MADLQVERDEDNVNQNKKNKFTLFYCEIDVNIGVNVLINIKS